MATRREKSDRQDDKQGKAIKEGMHHKDGHRSLPCCQSWKATPHKGYRRQEKGQAKAQRQSLCKDGAARLFVLYLCPYDLLYKGTFVRIFRPHSMKRGTQP